MITDLLLLGTIGAALTLCHRQRRDYERLSAPRYPNPTSGYPTVPISNRPTAELAAEWGAALEKDFRPAPHPWDVKEAETDPYKAIQRRLIKRM